MNRKSDSIKEQFKNTNDNDRPRICLALQGGGVHGAFEWGVLQALHEKNILEYVTGIYGTSAGAVNASALSYGLNLGDPDLAMQLVEEIWQGIAKSGRTLDATKAFTKMMFPFIHQTSKVQYPNLCPKEVGQGQNWLNFMAGNGLNYQTQDIKSRLSETIPDWDVIRHGHIETVIGVSKPVQRNGRIEMHEVLISNADINEDWVTASATIVGTYKINGIAYVDGGYTNNPPFPRGDSQKKYTDLVAAQVSEEPKGPLIPDLQINNINHNTFLYDAPWHELALIRQQGSTHVHVAGMKAEPHWDHTSKMNSDPRFIEDLRQRGYTKGLELANDLERNLGIRSSYNPQVSTSSQDLILDNIA